MSSKLGVVAIMAASALLLLSPAHDAQAGVHVSLLGGVDDALSPSPNTGIGGTGGVDLGFGLGMMADLTIGAEYLSRPFTVTTSVLGVGVSATGNASYLHVPALLFFHLAPMFSFGVGGFYDAAISTGAASNYGLSGALRIKLGMSPLFIEGRYNYGLDSSASDFGGNTSDVQGFIGLMF